MSPGRCAFSLSTGIPADLHAMKQYSEQNNLDASGDTRSATCRKRLLKSYGVPTLSSAHSATASRFKLFWLRGDSAFVDPDTYEYCEANRITYFIRLRENAVLTKLIKPHLQRPVGRPPKSGVQLKYVDLEYQAGSWERPRRVVVKIEWHFGELFPRYYFIVTNSKLVASKVVKVHNGRGDVENRIKEGKNTLRWDKTSCHRFRANEARLKMGFLAYNMLHLIRRFYLWGEDTRRSIEWIITRLVKAGARIVYHARR